MPTRRSVAEWGARGGLALAAVVSGYISVSHTVAQSIVGTAPAEAYRLAPYDGRFTGAFAQQISSAGLAQASQVVKAEILAKRALRQDPTTVSGVVSLGLVRLKQGNRVAAEHLLRYAQYLSRRDLPTQLWAIEDAVADGNIAVALRHYDIALRTSRRAPELLFPILASAISQNDVRAELVTFLSKKPQWTAAFIGYVAGSDADPITVSRLFLDLQRNGISISPDATALVIKRLITADAIGTAWNLYSRLERVGDRQSIRDPQFKRGVSTPSVFDWNPVNDNAIVTSFDDDVETGGFHFSVYSGGGGVLLHQLQLLPTGTYKIEGESKDIDQPQASLPYWSLTCNDGREILRLAVPSRGLGGGRFVASFSVPENCPVQNLALVARPSDSPDGVAGTIRWIRLSSVR